VPRLVHKLIVAVPGPVTVLVAVSVLIELPVKVAVALLEAEPARPDFSAQPQVPFAGERRE